MSSTRGSVVDCASIKCKEPSWSFRRKKINRWKTYTFNDLTTPDQFLSHQWVLKMLITTHGIAVPCGYAEVALFTRAMTSLTVLVPWVRCGWIIITVFAVDPKTYMKLDIQTLLLSYFKANKYTIPVMYSASCWLKPIFLLIMCSETGIIIRF